MAEALTGVAQAKQALPRSCSRAPRSTRASSQHQMEPLSTSRVQRSPLVQNGAVSEDDALAACEHAPAVCASLRIDISNLSDTEAHRVYEYYIPVFAWAKRRAQQMHDNALIVGISAPQGCGKTTLVSQLELLCAHSGLNAASISIDDFYLRGHEQDELALNANGNDLLQLRGNAGTHDVGLGLETIRKLQSARSQGEEVALPRYDKSLRQGKGDRALEEKWPRKRGPVDIVFVEGWMLGFTPVGEQAARAVDERLVAVDEQLQRYADLHALIDAWMVVQVGDPNWVYDWRLQAEHAMHREGNDAMSDAEVSDFVSRFMPAYTAYLPGLYSNGPHRASGKDVLHLNVDESRNLTDATDQQR